MSHFYFKYVCGLLALLTFLELCTADGKKKGSGTFGPYYQWAASYLPKKQYGHGHGQGGYGHGGHGHGGSGKRTLCFKKGFDWGTSCVASQHLPTQPPSQRNFKLTLVHYHNTLQEEDFF